MIPLVHRSASRSQPHESGRQLLKPSAVLLLRALLVAVLGAVGLTVVAGPAAAHARLISTSPGGGSTLDEAPEFVRLSFSEPIETTFAGVQVFGPDRDRVEAGEAQVEGDRVRVPLRKDLVSGRYTVVFRIISADGHPVKSQFRFSYNAPAPQPDPTDAASQPPPPASETTEAPSPIPSEDPDSAVGFELEDAGPGTAAGLWLSRFFTYAALTAVVGALVAFIYLLPTPLTDLRRRWLRRAAIAAGGWAAAAVALFIFGLSSIAARPLPEALNADLVRRFLETNFGLTILVQAALAALTAAVLAVGRSRATTVVATLLTATAAFTIPWSGHAGTDELKTVALTSAFTHIVGASAWVGGLVVLILLLRDATTDGAGLASRFSRLAGAAFVTVVTTGVINAALHMGTPANLWETNWGRLVVGKLIAVAIIGAFAWRNRNVLLPRIGVEGADGRAAFRRFAAGEVVVMAVAFGLAAGLASGIPADAEAASRIQSVVSQFGEGQINVTIDPAQVGGNLVHVYFLTEDGTELEAEDPSLTFTGEGETLEARLFVSGPGHYTVLSQQFPRPGEYEMLLEANVDGERQSTTATIAVR